MSFACGKNSDGNLTVVSGNRKSPSAHQAETIRFGGE